MSVSIDQVRAAKSKATKAFESLPVVGMGITRIGDGYGLKVNLSGQVEQGLIPADVDGVPITTEVVGSIHKS